MSSLQDDQDDQLASLITLIDEKKRTREIILDSVRKVREEFNKILSETEKRLIKESEEIFERKVENAKSLQEKMSLQVGLTGSDAIIDSLKSTLGRLQLHNKEFDNDDNNTAAALCVTSHTVTFETENKNSIEVYLNDKQLTSPNEYKCHTTPYGDHSDKCDIQFTPLQTGLHELKIGDQVVRKISARSFETIPTPCRPICEIVNGHSRYCSIKDNELYVTNRENPEMHVYDLKSGNLVRSLCGNFKKGRSIVLDRECLYVTDAIRGQFVKLSYDSSTLPVWFGKHGDNTGELNWPLGMKMDGQGKLFIASMKNKRIEIFKLFNNDWIHDYSISLKYKPFDIAFDKDGYMHVVFGDDSEKVSGVFIYDTNGEEISYYGINDVHQPGGIAISNNGYRFVTEYTEDGRLVIFDSQGQLLTYSVKLYYPMGVCVDESDGSVYVCSNLGNFVAQF